MKHVLVAIDGFDGGHAAVEEAVALAPALGATVTFVCVRKPVPQRLGSPFYERSPLQGLERARNFVEQAMETAAEAGLEADGEIIEIPPTRS